MERLRSASVIRRISPLLVAGMLASAVPLPWPGKVAAYVSWLERQLRGPEGAVALRVGLPEMQRGSVGSLEAFVELFVTACEREGLALLLRRALALPEHTPTRELVARLLGPAARMTTESIQGPLLQAAPLMPVGAVAKAFAFIAAESGLLSVNHSVLLVFTHAIALGVSYLVGSICLRGP